MLYIILLIIVIIASLGIILINTYNKYQIAIIKIDEAENNIDILLEKKLDFLTRIATIISDKQKEDDKLVETLKKLKGKDLNHFEMRDNLQKEELKINQTLDADEELSQLESITELGEELIDNNNDLNAAIKFYNDNVVVYNKLTRCFPSNVIGLFFRYKTKEFYINEKEEMFEILKNRD